jgi:glycosyltransferase involved in cell wall biosynthesis
MPPDPLPHIDVVIIGINVQRYLADCIASIRDADYPRELLEIIYVDGGSTDRSVAIGNEAGILVIELNDAHPTPGRGRNAGLFAATAPFVQFMDADTLLDRNWLKTALGHFDENIVAVCGKRSERWPDKNNYHIIASVEWNYEQGPCRYFGGDFLARREPLVAEGGFDDLLIAGEEPDFSARLRRSGWIIWRIADAMTLHDLNMTTFKQYWNRAYRSGHAYAEVGLRHLHTPEKLWARELARVSVTALLPFALILIGGLLRLPLLGLLLALAAALKPLLRIPRLMKQYRIDFKTALLYALHAAFVVYPQFLGIVRYLRTRCGGMPLLNKGRNNGLTVSR